jgi:integrase
MLQKIKRMGNGLYLWNIEVRYSGKRVHLHKVLTEAAANKLHAEMLEASAREKAGVEFAEVDANILSQAARNYIRELTRVGREDSHIADVRRTLDSLLATAGDMRVTYITEEHVRRWMQVRSETAYMGKPPSATTLNKQLIELHAFFRWLNVQVNPASHRLKVKRIAPAMRFVTWHDYSRFITICWQKRPQFALLMEVLAESGSRIDELLLAKSSEVDIRAKVWNKIVKRGLRISVDAGPWVLYAAQQSSDWLVPAEDGSRWTYSMIKRAMAMWQSKAGTARFTAHCLRHARACWDLADGRSVREVQVKLGHTSVLTTEKYLRAAELLRRSEAGITHSTNPVCHPCVKQGSETLSSETVRARREASMVAYKAKQAKDLQDKSL